MKILMISDYFPPEIGSASFLFYELAKVLIAKGDKIKVLTGFPRYNIDQDSLDERYRRRLFLNEKIDGIDVYRVRTFNLRRSVNMLRGIDQFLTAILYYLRALTLGGFDHVLIYSPPLPLGLTGYLLKVTRGKKTILNVQDLFPKSAIDLGTLKNKYMIKALRGLEKFLYLKSDYVTVHSKGNKKYVSGVTNGKARVAVVFNWVNTDEVCPGPKENDFSKKYDLAGKFVVSFAGVLGYSQDTDIIVNAAKSLKPYKDIVFLIVGDGRKKELIEKTKRDENIDNLILVPMQPKERYPFILHASDIGLVTLTSDVKSPVVPSKILNIMSSGKPVVASIPLDGDAPEIIKESGSGLCVEAGDLDGFVRSILEIYENESMAKSFGENGRRFIENKYSLKICSDRQREIFSSI
ncbi:MAG: glycosyltransferase family 4 protein [Candidatus Omnitrophica bacterium]|nr:glycosyltransferase family 4 protein [Candidatus Omnitrophota bacterium]